jgi:hypothetical protein
MHSTLRTIAFCALLPVSGFSQSNPPTAQALATFERFASHPASRITWSEEVDRIASPRSNAVITAIAVQDAADRHMRGVRIELSGEGVGDRIFIADEFVRPLIDALSEIEAEGPRFLGRRTGSSSCFGSALFLSALREGAKVFHGSLCEMSDGFTGMSVSTGTTIFRFPGVEPGRFKAALIQAVSAQKGLL